MVYRQYRRTCSNVRGDRQREILMRRFMIGRVRLIRCVQGAVVQDIAEDDVGIRGG